MDLLSKMSTYVRVVEAGSLSAAAKQLRISPAAVSRQITTLEGELATQLVARTTRRMSVTPSGRRYYERCLRILRDVEDAQAIGHAAELEGGLKISAPVTFGLASVVPQLRGLVAKHPALRLDIRLEDRVIDLVLEGVDVAIRVATAPPLSTEIVAHRLYAWQRILVASPSYLKRNGTPKTPAALARHDALSHAVDANVETWPLVNGDRSERVRMNVRCASNAGHVLRDLALDGMGIAMMPPWFVTAELEGKQLRHVLPGWGSEPIVVHALYRAMHRNEQRVRILVEHLRAAYSSIGNAR
jgi:DNA-binding transcriptional LysR family regulator